MDVTLDFSRLLQRQDKLVAFQVRIFEGVYSSSASERVHSAGFEEEFVEVLMSRVEAEFGLLEEDGEAGLSQPVELLMTPFCVAPEALDAVDVDAVLDKDGVRFA